MQSANFLPLVYENINPNKYPELYAQDMATKGARITQAVDIQKQVIANKQYGVKYVFCVAALIASLAISSLLKLSPPAKILLALIPVTSAVFVSVDRKNNNDELKDRINAVLNIYNQVTSWFTQLLNNKVTDRIAFGEKNKKSELPKSELPAKPENANPWKPFAVNTSDDEFNARYASDHQVDLSWAFILAKSEAPPEASLAVGWEKLKNACFNYIRQ